MDDKLVSAIFDAIKKEKASPVERRFAVIRAGQIAQAYLGVHEELLESVFGFPDGPFKDHVNSDAHSGDRSTH
jgi:hypothetical protein